MVDTQVRPSDVSKFPIIAAMLAIPREAFVLPAQRDTAYVGENLPLAQGRVMLSPRSFAKMLDVLDVQNDELVLDVGAGLGYSSAVIARMAQAVVAVEDDTTHADEAQAALADIGADNVIVHCGALAEGAPQHGPYDAIIIQGGIESLPAALPAQLKEGGRIVALFQQGALGVVRLGYLLKGHLSWRFAFNAVAPVLPGFAKPRGFTF